MPPRQAKAKGNPQMQRSQESRPQAPDAKNDQLVRELVPLLEPYNYTEAGVRELVRKHNYDREQIEAAVSNILDEEASWAKMPTKKEQKEKKVQKEKASPPVQETSKGKGQGKSSRSKTDGRPQQERQVSNNAKTESCQVQDLLPLLEPYNYGEAEVRQLLKNCDFNQERINIAVSNILDQEMMWESKPTKQETAETKKEAKERKALEREKQEERDNEIQLKAKEEKKKREADEAMRRKREKELAAASKRGVIAGSKGTTAGGGDRPGRYGWSKETEDVDDVLPKDPEASMQNEHEEIVAPAAATVEAEETVSPSEVRNDSETDNAETSGVEQSWAEEQPKEESKWGLPPGISKESAAAPTQQASSWSGWESNDNAAAAASDDWGPLWNAADSGDSRWPATTGSDWGAKPEKKQHNRKDKSDWREKSDWRAESEKKEHNRKGWAGDRPSWVPKEPVAEPEKKESQTKGWAPEQEPATVAPVVAFASEQEQEAAPPSLPLPEQPPAPASPPSAAPPAQEKAPEKEKEDGFGEGVVMPPSHNKLMGNIPLLPPVMFGTLDFDSEEPASQTELLSGFVPATGGGSSRGAAPQQTRGAPAWAPQQYSGPKPPKARSPPSHGSPPSQRPPNPGGGTTGSSPPPGPGNVQNPAPPGFQDGYAASGYGAPQQYSPQAGYPPQYSGGRYQQAVPNYAPSYSPGVPAYGQVPTTSYSGGTPQGLPPRGGWGPTISSPHRQQNAPVQHNSGMNNNQNRYEGDAANFSQSGTLPLRPAAVAGGSDRWR